MDPIKCSETRLEIVGAFRKVNLILPPLFTIQAVQRERSLNSQSQRHHDREPVNFSATEIQLRVDKSWSLMVSRVSLSRLYLQAGGCKRASGVAAERDVSTRTVWLQRHAWHAETRHPRYQRAQTEATVERYLFFHSDGPGRAGTSLTC